MNLASFRRLFVLVAFLFCASALHAEEGQSSQTPPPQNPPAGQANLPIEKPAARREDIDPKTLADAKTALATARKDRDAAEADLKKEQGAHTETKRQLADVEHRLTVAQDATKAAEKERDAAVKERDTVSKKASDLFGVLKKALNLTDEQVGKLTDDPAIVTQAIESLAGQKAIELAAAQGVPPVKPGAAKPADKTISRADFDNMPAQDRNHFIRNGGKVTD